MTPAKADGMDPAGQAPADQVKSLTIRQETSWQLAPRVTRTARRVSLDLSCEEKLVVPANASRICDPIERLRPQLLDGPIRVR